MNAILEKLKYKNKSNFLQKSEHNWINEHYLIAASFNRLNSITKKYKKINKYLDRIVFIQSNGQYACAISADVHIIIIFPELIFLMKNGKLEQAVAILLHEIGHIVLEHQKSTISNDQAQIEADIFSANLGQGLYLYYFLMDQRKSIQIDKRIRALQSFLNIS